MSKREKRVHMRPAELVEIIEELGWTHAFAADYVFRNPRNVRRWIAGEAPITKEVAQGFRDRPRALAYEMFARRAEEVGL